MHSFVNTYNLPHRIRTVNSAFYEEQSKSAMFIKANEMGFPAAVLHCCFPGVS